MHYCDCKGTTKLQLLQRVFLRMLTYSLDIYLEPTDEYTTYMHTEIWIRPTITYGLVACFVREVEKT